MKATIPWLGSALVAVLAVSAADAQVPGGCRVRRAPDACGPGYYAPNINGLWYGPNYDVRPPCGPFNGVLFHPSPKEQVAQQNTPNNGPYGYYGPRPAGPYALNNPTPPGAPAKPGSVEPGPYRGPTGGEALRGPNPAGPNNPYAIYGSGGLYDRYVAGPGGAYALNLPPPPPAPYGPYAYYAPPAYAPPCPEGEGLPTAPPPAVFPTHPYARSPRDFFMEGDENPYPVSGGGYAASSTDYGASPTPSPPVYSPPTAPPTAPLPREVPR